MDVGIELDVDLDDAGQAHLLQGGQQLRVDRGDVLHALADGGLTGVEHRQELRHDVLGGPLALLDALLVDAALVVLELGLHAAGQVQVLVALRSDLLGDLDHLDELALEDLVLGDVGVLPVGTGLRRGVEDLVLDTLRGVDRCVPDRVGSAHLSSSMISASTTSSSEGASPAAPSPGAPLAASVWAACS